MFSFKKVFGYLYIFVKPYKVAFFSLFFFALGRVIFSSAIGGYIYKNIIDTLNNEVLSIEARYEIVIALLVAISFSFVTSILMNRYGEFIFLKFLTKTIKNIYDFCFRRLMLHSYGFYANNFGGSIVAKVKRFARSFEIITNNLIYNFFTTIMVVAVSIGMLYFQSRLLATYFFIWCLIYALMVVVFMRQKVKFDLKKAEADSKLTGVLSDSISNILNIKVFSAFYKEFSYFQERTNYLSDRLYISFRFSSIRQTIQAIFITGFHIFVLITMLHLWKKGEITVGVFVMAYIYLVSIIDRIWDLSSALARFMEALTDAKEMVDIFETEIEVKDPENPEVCKIQDGVIEFKNVLFSYKDGADVLDNFNLKIAKGEKVGLVGHSGSGKSTITKLILRFADASVGDILIDGQNIANIRQDDLRSNISYVPQESILFHRTIGENIGYAKDDATKEEIEEAARLAYADIFINQTQMGYETMVGERGVKLSGGERQRVSIARAMLKNAPILILDEATSSLDSINESYIQNAFGELMKGKTTIVVAHRLSTIQKMDRIIVLDSGKIVEEGTHQELLEKGGFYSTLWNHQTGSFLD